MKRRNRTPLIIGLVVAFAVAVAVTLVVMRKQHKLTAERQHLAESARSGPVVQTTAVALSPPEQWVALTAEARPYQMATLVAKITGYVAQVAVDKGDQVTAGQTVAIIAAPETTEQLKGATADSINKARIAERMRDLFNRKLVSEQDYEQSQSDARVAAARVGQLGAEKGYQILQAPFAGTVVARNIDPGTLVSPGAQGVMTIAQLDRLRIYAYIDQRHAFFLKVGLPVELSMHERPGVHLAAALGRLTGQLDPRTRMMLVEVDFDNTKHDIVPGSFVQMTLKVPTTPVPQVPVDAVVQRQDKYFVPTVTAGQVQYKPVEIGNTDGHSVEILNGLKPGELVARNVGDSLAEGSKVRPQDAPKEAPEKSTAH